VASGTARPLAPGLSNKRIRSRLRAIYPYSLYNVAAFRASNVRLEDTFGFETAKEAHRADMEISSSRHYDCAIGTLGLDFLSQMLRGLIKTVEKKYVLALEIFSSINLTNVPSRMQATIYADMAWCNASINRLDLAWPLAEVAALKLSEVSDQDDIAYVASRISQVACVYNRHDDAAHFSAIAKSAILKHREFQTELFSRLQSVLFV
jgi:hypothetical protein